MESPRGVELKQTSDEKRTDPHEHFGEIGTSSTSGTIRCGHLATNLMRLKRWQLAMVCWPVIAVLVPRHSAS
jgi:hypothetical protein